MPYLDPGTLMPVASAVAVVTGFLMMFWRRVVGAARGAAQFVRKGLSRLFSSR
jgi:hypothetical protein